MANRMLLLCVATWTLPTLLAGPLYASICDSYSQRLSIGIPFGFLIAACASLMAQVPPLSATKRENPIGQLSLAATDNVTLLLIVHLRFCK